MELNETLPIISLPHTHFAAQKGWIHLSPHFFITIWFDCHVLSIPYARNFRLQMNGITSANARLDFHESLGFLPPFLNTTLSPNLSTVPPPYLDKLLMDCCCSALPCMQKEAEIDVSLFRQFFKWNSMNMCRSSPLLRRTLHCRKGGSTMHGTFL